MKLGVWAGCRGEWLGHARRADGRVEDHVAGLRGDLALHLVQQRRARDAEDDVPIEVPECHRKGERGTGEMESPPSARRAEGAEA